jgi:chromosome segregation ATPase
MFSTVALLLALWSAMEVPFRALDEFDVYMDAINRKISIKLLVDVSFFFLFVFVWSKTHLKL